MTARAGWTRDDLASALALVAIKLAVSCAILAAGFSHISDDDYARTVIAQTFAHAPRLDPSGTSWLPFPFWVTGAAMMAFGRTLLVARIVAIVLSSLAAVAPFAGARAMGVPRWIAMIGALVAAGSPLSVWLGAATVPEGLTGLVVAGSVFAIASSSPRAWALGALGLFVACLSRYEPWPVALASALVLAWRGARARSAATIALAALAALGPLAWMAWNAHAHGDALHFFARVSAFRRGHAAASLYERLTGYPRALASSFPEALIALLAGLPALRDAALRRAWRLPLALALLSLLALVAGDVRDGAPTHHPERALVAIAVTLVAFGAHGLASWTNGRARPAFGAVCAAWIAATAWRVGDLPGTGADDRAAQIAAGDALRALDVRVEVTPCAYEHFALIAACDAPERVTVLAATGAPVSADCPTVHPSWQR